MPKLIRLNATSSPQGPSGSSHCLSSVITASRVSTVSTACRSAAWSGPTAIRYVTLMRNPSTTITRTLNGLGLGLKATMPPTRKANEPTPNSRA